MVCSDKTLCEMMLRLLAGPGYARWSGEREEIRDIRDLLTLARPDQESGLLGDFFRKNRRFWWAITADLTRDVFGLLSERAANFTAIRQHRPLTGEEEEEGVRVKDLFKTIMDLNAEGLACGPPR